MYRRLAVLLWGGVLLIAAGCGAGSRWSGEQPQPEQPAESRLSGVAVVDLDEVARQLGKDVKLVAAIKQGQESLNQQLRALQLSLREKYQQAARESEVRPAGGEVPKESQEVQLANLERQLNLQLNQARHSAQVELKTHQQRLIQQFRDEIKPVAQRVAAKRGLGVVMTKNDSLLLTFDNAHEITAEVVETLWAGQPSAPAAETARRPTELTRQR